MARLGWSIAPFWVSRGYLAEAQHWMEATLAGGRRLASTGSAMARAVLAFCAIGQGLPDQAARLLAESLVDARCTGDRPLLAVIHAFRAHALAQCRHADAAMEAAQQAIALFDELDWDWGRGLGYLALALLRALDGQTAEAQRLAGHSEALLRRDGSWWYLLVCLNLQIQLALTTGDIARAIATCGEGLDTVERIRDTTALAVCLTGLAGALTLQKQPERAARLFGAAEVLREQTGGAIHPASRRALYERHVALLRESLSPETLAAEWAKGRSLTAEEALTEAREDISASAG
jgi:tetratricopeptide (TPR) repeat protein